MAKYLVTGGAGFIGSHLVEGLVGRGESVRVLDNLCEGSMQNLAAVASEIEFVRADLRDIQAVEAAVQGVEFIFHQAALRSVPQSIDDPVATHEVNVTGTLQLLMAARQAGVKRVVIASSSSVYGGTEEREQSETDRPNPLSPYGVSKLASEGYASVFARVYGLETVSVRYFNVFGPRQDPASEYAAVIPRFILAALSGEPLEIHGDGLQSRDFTYVDNVVDLNLQAMATPGISGQIINAGCGHSCQVLHIKTCLERILQKKLASYHTPPRKGDVRHSRADMRRAQRLLDYEVKVPFEDGLLRTVEFFRDLKLSDGGVSGDEDLKSADC